MQQRPPGNPIKRRKGETVRAVLAVTVKPDAPMPLATLCELVGLSHSGVCRHLSTLEMQKRIRGYTTRGGMVRVW
jgi:predicted ArsR family transcriptional regulator